jgi:hypothetical protein
MNKIKTQTGISLPAIPFLAEYKPLPPVKHSQVLRDDQVGLKDSLVAFTEEYSCASILESHRNVKRGTATSTARRLAELGLLYPSKLGRDNWRIRYRLTPKGLAEKQLIMEKINEQLPRDI